MGSQPCALCQDSDCRDLRQRHRSLWLDHCCSADLQGQDGRQGLRYFQFPHLISPGKILFSMFSHSEDHSFWSHIYIPLVEMTFVILFPVICCIIKSPLKRELYLCTFSIYEVKNEWTLN